MNYRLGDVMGTWKTPDFRWRTILFVLAVPLLALLISVGCSGTPGHDKPLRLVDEFRDAMVQGSPTQVGQTKPLGLWDFSREPQSGGETPANLGWMVGDGVTGLSVHQGRLKGKTRTDFPVIYVKRTSRLDEDDLLHSAEVRMRASDGTNLRMSGAGPDPPNFEEIIAAARGIPWLDTTPILPGENFQTYTIPVARPAPASKTHHVFISPTDVPGADFEIESVRLVTRKEYLSRIPSGVSWQGLSDIYREALVSRSPESIEVPLRLPERPWLDLGIGTPEDEPVTFSVHVVEGSGTRLLRRRTLTTPHRWESVPLDLSEYGGREISLRLSLSAAEGGRLGFWGSPAIRSRGQQGAGAESGIPQGVILIVADTLRADHLNFHGYGRETAPFLTEMASRGAVFKNSIAQATWTKVSVPSIVTSLYPTSHGVIDFADRLPAAATTLAEVYREAGYATVGYSSVLFSGEFTNLHQGYEELHESGSTSKEKPSKTAREYVDRLADWLEIHRDGPFFAFLHVFDPHHPYEPHRPYNSMWVDLSRKKEHEEQLEQVRKVIQDPLMKRFGMPSREELLQVSLDPEAYVDYDIGWYDGSIRAMDAELARLVERLEGLGLAESTLLVFTSDHGEEFLDHGKMFHGQSVYGELSRVPLLFFRPGRIREGVAVEETVQTIDIMPTLLELSGLSGPGGLMGQSLVPLMVSRESESAAEVADWSSRPSITEKNRTGTPAGPANRDIEQTAIIYDGWKLVVTARENSDDPTRFELFRQPDDPLDQEDRADQHPKVVQELREMLAQWREVALAARLTEEDPTTGMSQEELQRLKSLGYIQ